MPKIKIVESSDSIDVSQDLLDKLRELEWHKQGFDMALRAMQRNNWHMARVVLKIMSHACAGNTPAERARHAEIVLGDGILDYLKEGDTQ